MWYSKVEEMIILKSRAIVFTDVNTAEFIEVETPLLPENSVLQEGVTLEFFSTYARLYTGPDLALAAYPDEGELVVCELLGSPESAPGILTALGFNQGSFRTPGSQTSFAMYLSLNEDPTIPTYFGLNLN